MSTSTLSSSQEAALAGLIRWYNGGNRNIVLHGAAGSGKSYLLDVFLRTLGNGVTPLLLADTNEAVNVLKVATGGKYDTLTICSALGLHLGHDGAKQVLVRRQEPDLSKYSLIVVDEASTVDKVKLDYLLALGKYILWCGHKSQLPPVDTNLRISDLCLSPVFEQGFPTLDLIQPMRNKGRIYSFCLESEQLIYKRGVLSNEFKVNSSFLADYLLTNTEELLSNKAVLLAYTNKRVDELNTLVRKSIFKGQALEELFLPKDKLIIRSPMLMFLHPLNETHTSIDKLLRNKKVHQLNTNARAEVVKVTYKEVLGITCYELFVVTIDLDTMEVKKGCIYYPINETSYETLRSKYYTKALYCANPVQQHKLWGNYHDLTKVLGNIKHSYALTVHNSQGSTIDTVFVCDKDIDKCGNPILRKKLRYVAYSRAKNSLFRL